MRLLFDIGNTRLKWAVESDNQFIDQGVIAHSDFDLTSLARRLCGEYQFTDIWVSSVSSKSVDERVNAWLDEQFGVPVYWAAVAPRVGRVSNHYEDMSQLGVDRWLAVLGADALLEQSTSQQNSAAIVIDAGTAVTIDVLDHQSVYRGGVILPGSVLMHDSLVGRTEGIHSTIAKASQVIGRTTQECVNSGAYYGLLGAVERTVDEIKQTLALPDQSLELFVTGGDSLLFVENSRLDLIHISELVLMGLKRIADEAQL